MHVQKRARACGCVCVCVYVRVCARACVWVCVNASLNVCVLLRLHVHVLVSGQVQKCANFYVPCTHTLEACWRASMHMCKRVAPYGNKGVFGLSTAAPSPVNVASMSNCNLQSTR